MILALATAGCQASTDQVRGVVIVIERDIDNTIIAFELVAEDGTRLTFSVGRDVTFVGSPLSHLNSHFLSADPVLVVYEEGDEELVAISLRDG